MSDLPHAFDRTVLIKAPRDAVFRYFTEDARWAAWWGAGSTIDARPGGKVLICYPGGVEVSGEVLEVAPPERIVFTYGYRSGTPFGPGASRVELRLEAVPAGTRLHLVHHFAEAPARDQHAQGWRYQLAVFANVVTNDRNSRVADTIRTWWAAWSNPDAPSRRTAIEGIVAPSIRFSDRFGLVEGREELLVHLTAIHTFMPGMKIESGPRVLHCQGKVIAAFIATDAEGRPKGAGSNVFSLDADGRFEEVTGFWQDEAPKGAD